MNEQIDYWLTLTLSSGLGAVLIGRCVKQLGCAKAVVDATASQLSRIEGIGEVRANRLRRTINAVLRSDEVAKEKQLIADYGVTTLTLEDADYPKLLKHIYDPPPVLYVRGKLQKEDALSLAVVGSRRCSRYGREQADRLSAASASAGLCIISGGAYGIDEAAHQACLRIGGRTIAVLGSGIAKPYPDAHSEMFARIADRCGAVISELPMNTPPIAQNFPARNRIISGLSLGVLVVEAATRSGALITARLAAEEHHREVMAVPGPVNSATSGGCHKMIREGWATLVTNAGEILDALGDAGQTLKAIMQESEPSHRGQTQHTRQANDLANTPTNESPLFSSSANIRTSNLTASQNKILQTLTSSQAIDQLVAITNLPVHMIQADLTILEIRGLVTRKQGRYQQKNN